MSMVSWVSLGCSDQAAGIQFLEIYSQMTLVMPRLVPGIHAFASARKLDVDGRDIPAKTRFALLPGHDGN